VFLIHESKLQMYEQYIKSMRRSVMTLETWKNKDPDFDNLTKLFQVFLLASLIFESSPHYVYYNIIPCRLLFALPVFSDILTSLPAHAVPNVSIRAGSISDFRKSKRYR